MKLFQAFEKRSACRAVTLALIATPICGASQSSEAQTAMTGINCSLEPSVPAQSFRYPMDAADGQEWQVTNPFANVVTRQAVPGLPAGYWQHTGIDYVLGGNTTQSQERPVHSVAAGVVVFSTKSNSNPLASRGGLVVIRHRPPPGMLFRVPAFSRSGHAGTRDASVEYAAGSATEVVTYYLHLDPGFVLVSQGEQVGAGQEIGRTYSLATKRRRHLVYPPHLHLEIWNECTTLERNGYDSPGEFQSVVNAPLLDPESFLATFVTAGRPRAPDIVAEDTSISAAMLRFQKAITSGDVETFLSLFSRTGTWRYRILVAADNDDPPVSKTFSYSELARELRQRGDWYCVLFGGEALSGCGRPYASHFSGEGSWQRVGTRFVPPDSGRNSVIGVRWRKEAGRWVVDEIGDVET